MINEHVEEKTLENASESFKSLLSAKVGLRKSELTLFVGGIRGGRSIYFNKEVMDYIRKGGVFATPGYAMSEEDTGPNQYKGYDVNSYWFDDAARWGWSKTAHKKPDWKCTAMERHTRKAEPQSRPTKMIKALIGSMEPVMYGNDNPDRPANAKGAW